LDYSNGELKNCFKSNSEDGSKGSFLKQSGKDIESDGAKAKDVEDDKSRMMEVITPADVIRYMGLYGIDMDINVAMNISYPLRIPCLSAKDIPLASLRDSVEMVISRILNEESPTEIVGLTDGRILGGTLTIHSAAVIIVSRDDDSCASPRCVETILECVRRLGLHPAVLSVASYQENTASVTGILQKMMRQPSHHIWRLNEYGQPNGLVLIPHIIAYMLGISLTSG
jgi:hypothetical protein